MFCDGYKIVHPEIDIKTLSSEVELNVNNLQKRLSQRLNDSGCCF